MSKSRKSTKKNSRTRRKRGGGGRQYDDVVTCENLNRQLSRYREYIQILKSDDARKWQGMLDKIERLKVSLSNSYKVGGRRRRGGAPENDESERYRRAIDDAETEAANFYKSSSLSKLDYDMKEDVRSGIDHYNEKIEYIKKNPDWVAQGCKDTVEGGRKRTRRKKRRRRRKSTKKKRRRKSTKKKRRRRRL